MKIKGGHCERSEAIFVFTSPLVRDCFVDLLLAMIPQNQCSGLLNLLLHQYPFGTQLLHIV